MKRTIEEIKRLAEVYISLPISGQEDTYEQRLAAAVECVKKKFPDAEIITPKDVKIEVDGMLETRYGTYGEYLGADIATIIDKCDKVVFCDGFADSKGCRAELQAALLFGKDIHLFVEEVEYITPAQYARVTVEMNNREN